MKTILEIIQNMKMTQPLPNDSFKEINSSFEWIKLKHDVYLPEAGIILKKGDKIIIAQQDNKNSK